MFLDTSGLLCVLDRRETAHRDAVSLVAATFHATTHTGIVFELVPLAASRGLMRRVVLDFIEGLHANPSVEILQVEEQDYRDALDLLRTRLDKSWSLCDAVSFELMRKLGLTDALTTDHHFEQAGFIRLLSH